MQSFYLKHPKWCRNGADQQHHLCLIELSISINGLDYQVCLLHLTHDSNPNFLDYPDVSRPYIESLPPPKAGTSPEDLFGEFISKYGGT